MTTILIIDNSTDTTELFRCLFSNDYQIFEAVDGQQGIEQFKAHHPDIIITELAMPVLDGFNLVRRVRQLSEKVKIIACSSYFSFPLERGKMLKAGANICLTAPVDVVELEEAVFNFSN
ncbi:MAG: response regulator [Acidobacteriota bacterium]